MTVLLRNETSRKRSMRRISNNQSVFYTLDMLLTMNGEAVSLHCNYPKRLRLLPPWVPLKNNRYQVQNNKLEIYVQYDPTEYLGA